MTNLPGIMMIAALATGQVGDATDLAVVTPQEQAAGIEPGSIQDRRAVLQQALADFDAAVATRDPSHPEVRRLYRQALAGFDSLLNAGANNSGLHYNAANAHLRLGEIGKAIVHYRRALRLAPGDERIRKNLQSARNLCRVRIPIPAAGAFLQTLFFWHFDTSMVARIRVVLASYVLFWLLMLVRLFGLRHLPLLLWAIRAIAAVTLIVGVSVAWERLAMEHRIEGVIIDQEVVLRKGNGEYYEPQLDGSLSEGVEFRFLETRDDVDGIPWYHVRLRDRKTGWLRADQADVI